MSNIVWVFGSCGAGKETFIKHVIQNPKSEVSVRLGWENKKIMPVYESIQYIGQYDNDPIVNEREKIIQKACNLAEKNADIILIKGQDVDISNNIPNRLVEQIKNSQHEIIFLNADMNTLYSRVQKKKLV